MKTELLKENVQHVCSDLSNIAKLLNYYFSKELNVKDYISLIEKIKNDYEAISDNLYHIEQVLVENDILFKDDSFLNQLNNLNFLILSNKNILHEQILVEKTKMIDIYCTLTKDGFISNEEIEEKLNMLIELKTMLCELDVVHFSLLRKDRRYNQFQ